MSIIPGTFLQAKDLKLGFHEKGNDYIENIKIKNKSVEFDVPEHAGLDAAKYLNDYKAVSLIYSISG